MIDVAWRRFASYWRSFFAPSRTLRTSSEKSSSETAVEPESERSKERRWDEVHLRLNNYFMITVFGWLDPNTREFCEREMRASDFACFFSLSNITKCLHQAIQAFGTIQNWFIKQQKTREGISSFRVWLAWSNHGFRPIGTRVIYCACKLKLATDIYKHFGNLSQNQWSPQERSNPRFLEASIGPRFPLLSLGLQSWYASTRWPKWLELPRGSAENNKPSVWDVQLLADGDNAARLARNRIQKN